MVPQYCEGSSLPNTVNQVGKKPHTVGIDDTAIPHFKIENTAWKKAQYRKPPCMSPSGKEIFSEFIFNFASAD